MKKSPEKLRNGGYISEVENDYKVNIDTAKERLNKYLEETK